LRVYNARTGEWLRDLELPEQVQGDYFPCNNVLVDDAGNLLISNMLLKINNTPLVIYSVDPSNGDVALRATLSTNESAGRIDHIDVTGDVTSGNFEVFAALSRSNEIIRWTMTNGSLTDTKVVAVSQMYPSSAANFGTSPRIKALDSDRVIVHGSGIEPTVYSMTNGAILDSFASNQALMSESAGNDGIETFVLGERHFLFYSNNDYQTTTGHNFKLAVNADGDDFAGFSPLWTLPKSGMGVVNSTTMSTPCLAVPGDKSNEVFIYMYVPGNGLAKYTVTVAVAVHGDVNGDGEVTAADVTALYSYLLNNDTTGLVNGDQTGDGIITSADVTAVYNILLGN
jgi:hypothetical protein